MLMLMLMLLGDNAESLSVADATYYFPRRGLWGEEDGTMLGNRKKDTTSTQNMNIEQFYFPSPPKT